MAQKVNTPLENIWRSFSICHDSWRKTTAEVTSKHEEQKLTKYQRNPVSPNFHNNINKLRIKGYLVSIQKLHPDQSAEEQISHVWFLARRNFNWTSSGTMEPKHRVQLCSDRIGTIGLETNFVASVVSQWADDGSHCTECAYEDHYSNKTHLIFVWKRFHIYVQHKKAQNSLTVSAGSGHVTCIIPVAWAAVTTAAVWAGGTTLVVWATVGWILFGWSAETIPGRKCDDCGEPLSGAGVAGAGVAGAGGAGAGTGLCTEEWPGG